MNTVVAFIKERVGAERPTGAAMAIREKVTLIIILQVFTLSNSGF